MPAVTLSNVQKEDRESIAGSVWFKSQIQPSNVFKKLFDQQIKVIWCWKQ